MIEYYRKTWRRSSEANVSTVFTSKKSIVSKKTKKYWPSSYFKHVWGVVITYITVANVANLALFDHVRIDRRKKKKRKKIYIYIYGLGKSLQGERHS
jgi:FlaA1/EpsC-like NDP-sugar epimerase